MMLFSYAIFIFSTLVAAVPAISKSAPASIQTVTSSGPASTATACQAKTFNQPWALTDITIYWAAGQEPSNQYGSFSFTFCDYNEGLQMETQCQGTVVDNRCQEDDGGYVQCANNTVAFKLAPDLIMLERSFVDDCLGPYPYNGGQAFGQNNTQMQTEDVASGTVWSQGLMLVEITQMT